MSIAYIIRVTFGIIGLIVSTYTFGQNTTSRLTLGNEGETIFFNFNSFEKYRTGISMSTFASVYFIDTTDLGTTTALQWDLMVRANSNFIEGDYGNTLPLSTIRIVANGLPQCQTITLSNADQPVVNSANQDPLNGYKNTLTFTYDIGRVVPLLGEDPDYYYVDIIYTLQPH